MWIFRVVPDSAVTLSVLEQSLLGHMNADSECTCTSSRSPLELEQVPHVPGLVLSGSQLYSCSKHCNKHLTTDLNDIYVYAEFALMRIKVSLALKVTRDNRRWDKGEKNSKENEMMMSRE